MPVKTMEAMVNWVEAHLFEKPTLSGLSEYLGYTPFYCSTKFREYTGMAFREYLNQKRLSQAARELRDGEEGILEIALRYGFSSHEAFTRAFVRRFGCVPSLYRRKTADSEETG